MRREANGNREPRARRGGDALLETYDTKEERESKATATFTDSLRINMSVRRASSRGTGQRSSITSSPDFLRLAILYDTFSSLLLAPPFSSLTIRGYFSRDPAGTWKERKRKRREKKESFEWQTTRERLCNGKSRSADSPLFSLVTEFVLQRGIPLPQPSWIQRGFEVFLRCARVSRELKWKRFNDRLFNCCLESSCPLMSIDTFSYLRIGGLSWNALRFFFLNNKETLYNACIHALL